MKTVVGRVITLKGVKPIGRVKWVRQAFYIYGLFEPETGENFYYEFSHVATDCFQVFLDGFSQAYPEDLHVIQLDRGSFHSGQDLIIPDNVVLLFQPAHSPELNPAIASLGIYQKSIALVSGRYFNRTPGKAG